MSSSLVVSKLNFSFYTLYGSVGMTAVLCSETLHELARRSIVAVKSNVSGLKCIAVSENTSKSKNILQDIFATRAGSVCERFSTNEDKCLVSNAKITHGLIPSSIETLVLNQYDNLDITEQTILSHASIIGDEFSRSLLFGMCEDMMTKHRFNLSIQNLMSSTLLKCARDLRQQSIGHKLASIRRRRMQIKDRHVIVCECPENHTNLAFLCQMLAFTRVSLRWSLFNSQTREARSLRHHAVIKFLEKKFSNDLKVFASCEYCAGKGYTIIFDSPEYEKALEVLIDVENINLQSALKLEDIVQEIRLSHLENDSVDIPQGNIRSKSISWKQIGIDAAANAIMQGTHFIAKSVSSEIKHNFDFKA